MGLLDDITTHVVDLGFERAPRLDSMNPMNGRTIPAYLHMVDGNYIFLMGKQDQPVIMFHNNDGSPAGDGLVPTSILEVDNYIAKAWPVEELDAAVPAEPEHDQLSFDHTGEA